MLVLTRKIGQRVIVGENEVVITIISVTGDQVRLGFEADQRVSIHREEVKRDIDEGRQRHG